MVCTLLVSNDKKEIYIKVDIQIFNHLNNSTDINKTIDAITKKIIDISKKIKRTNKGHLYLGNIDIWRDWGWAPEYVNAMWLMMQQKKPIDLVIGSGKKK